MATNLDGLKGGLGRESYKAERFKGYKKLTDDALLGLGLSCPLRGDLSGVGRMEEHNAGKHTGLLTVYSEPAARRFQESASTEKRGKTGRETDERGKRVP